MRKRETETDRDRQRENDNGNENFQELGFGHIKFEIPTRYSCGDTV